MKKLIIGLVLWLSITILANVSPGGNIAASLFNALLSVEVNSGKTLYSAKLSSTGAVSNESGDWIDGDCTNPTATVYNCTLNNPQSVVLNCVFNQFSGSGGPTAVRIFSNTDNTLISVENGGRGGVLMCHNWNGSSKTIKDIMLENGFIF